MDTILFVVIVGAIYWIIRNLWTSSSWMKPEEAFPSSWRVILTEKAAYYNALSAEEKTQFEYRVQEFLLNCRITGIDVDTDETDNVLVAASAIIPVFKFPDWRYSNLFEVLIYPGAFNDKFETTGPERSILGMVGTGYMEGKMILSKRALHLGFSNESDKQNTAIHEFVHLIDKADGTVDGVPESLLGRQYTIPWLNLINVEIGRIHEGKSEIRPYGGMNKAEFFAVASEYFFEKPKQLESNHPELYRSMQKIFNQNIISRNLEKKKFKIRRNSPCPCESGEKFKKCCGRKHYN